LEGFAGAGQTNSSQESDRKIDDKKMNSIGDFIAAMSLNSQEFRRGTAPFPSELFSYENERLGA
jgi:hypothetical protein